MKRLYIMFGLMIQIPLLSMISDHISEDDDDRELSHIINTMNATQKTTQKKPDLIIEKLATIYTYKRGVLTQKIEDDALQKLCLQLQQDWESLDVSEQSIPVLIPFYLMNEYHINPHLENLYPSHIRQICKINHIEFPEMRLKYHQNTKKLKQKHKDIENERSNIIKRLAELEQEASKTKIEEIKSKIEYQTLCGYMLCIKIFTDTYHTSIKQKITAIESLIKELDKKNNADSLAKKSEQEKLLFDIRQDYEKLNHSLQSTTDTYKGSFEKTTERLLGQTLSGFLLNPEDQETAQTRLNFVNGWDAYFIQYWNAHPIQL